jgi:VTC domain
MRSDRGLDALHRLDAIDLDELRALADLQTRRDRKYLVPTDYVSSLLERIPGRALEIDGARSFRYESVYFDTPDLRCYFDAAQRRPRRFKVRTRSYLDGDDCMVEVKCRDSRDRTVKHRHPHSLDRRAELDDDARGFVRSLPPASAAADQLATSLTVSYRRATIVLRSGDARITIDGGLAWHQRDRRPLELPDLSIIETKTTGAPSPVDRLLWRDGHRPTVISKYCTGLAALSPDLPANKWHRTLQRHLGHSPRAAALT